MKPNEHKNQTKKFCAADLLQFKHLTMKQTQQQSDTDAQMSMTSTATKPSVDRVWEWDKNKDGGKLCYRRSSFSATNLSCQV